MRRKYGGKRKWGRRRFWGNPRMKFGWLNQSGQQLGAATGGNPEPIKYLVKGTDMYPASGVKVLDWSPGARYLLERVVLTIAVTVTATATKALMRWVFGLRLVQLDAGDLMADLASKPSLLMADEDDTRTDWLWTGEAYVNCLGDATAVYTNNDHPIQLDFKPKRWLKRDEALILQWAPVTVAGAYFDATHDGLVSGKLGFLSKAPVA